MNKAGSVNPNRSNPKQRKSRTPCSFLSLPPSHCCTIVESIGEGVITVDLQKKVTYLNPAAEAMTGFAAQEAIGQKCFGCGYARGPADGPRP
jgi:transcriptional regulator with PAS, ATPase and Fis domain